MARVFACAALFGLLALLLPSVAGDCTTCVAPSSGPCIASNNVCYPYGSGTTCPPNTSPCSGGTTTTTPAPATTTHAPATTTHAPATTTHAPATTTHAPATTTHAPATTTHAPATTSSSAPIVGIWWWTWSSPVSLPTGVNLGVAFSGWVDPSSALSDSSSVKNSLPGTKYISFGGGNSNGYWTLSTISSIQSDINAGSFAGYQGLVFDIEEGDAGLSSNFLSVFSTAKANGFEVLVTISHSAPYGISDAATLMSSFLSSSNIDIISPQLYSSGTETANDYTADTVAWSAYVGAKAKFVPSIVTANLYSSAQSYFTGQGITTAGYIQWKNN